MHIGLNAHLLSSQAGYRTAGIHGYIDNLLRHLPTAAPDMTFTAMTGARYTGQYPGMSMRRASWDTERPTRRILWEQLIQPGELAGFDLLHGLGFVLPVISRTPGVVTVYDLSFIHYPERLPAARRLYLRLFTAYSVRQARRILAISHSTAQDLQTTFGIPASKIDVAAPGCDPAYRPLPQADIQAFRAKKNLPERFILFLGTLEPRKNLPVLLNAYADLPESERIPLVLGGGKGWQYDEIFATIEQRGLTRSVILPGFVPTDELPLWYNSAALFAYPSVFEGFGLPVLEAMACGTPVIVSDASSLPEVAGNAGLTIAPNDTAAWTDALHTGLTDEAWCANARQRGLDQAARFTWQETASHTVNSYRAALKMD